jgi:hypothetical protein
LSRSTSGADDYVTKPFGMAELLARVRVAVRRGEQAKTGGRPHVVEAAQVRIDFDTGQVTVEGRPVRLTPFDDGAVVELCRLAAGNLQALDAPCGVHGLAGQSRYPATRGRVARRRPV